MAYESNFITFIGNLTDDPELRFTGDGAAVATLRVASNRRLTDRTASSRRRRPTSTSTAGVTSPRTPPSRCTRATA